MEVIILHLTILANLVLPHGRHQLVQLIGQFLDSSADSSSMSLSHTSMPPSVRPVNSMPTQIRTATCHLVIGPYCTDAMCHPLSGATCHLLIGPYTCHVIFSIPYRCHVSPYQWCHVIMFVQYGCRVTLSVVPRGTCFCQFCL